MKEKIAIHLENLTKNFLKGVDFQTLEMIGPKNVQALINFVLIGTGKNNDEIREQEMKLTLFKDDIMETEKIFSYMNYLKICVGNRRLLASNLKSIFYFMKSLNSTSYPLLPNLRLYDSLKKGDDVMVNLCSGFTKERESDYLETNYNWVCGKVLAIDGDDYAHVFLNNKAHVQGSLDGRFHKAYLPCFKIFSRADFFKIREMILSEDGDAFMKLFYENCIWPAGRYERPDIETMKEIISDPNIEPMTDEELLQNSKLIINDALRITKKNLLYIREAELLSKLI